MPAGPASLPSGRSGTTRLDDLPQLSRLRVFRIAARHCSFTRAARDLGVTQAAVSHQIRTLETELGIALFVRRQRGLELTDAGQRLFRTADVALGILADGIDDVRSRASKPRLTVGATQAVATFWLVPRLPLFQARHPDLRIRLVTSDRGFEKIAGVVDVGMAFGRGTWPGLDSALVRAGRVFPVCSPAYRLSGPDEGPRCLLEETLLCLESDRSGLTDWPQWFASLGVRGSGEYRRKLIFSSYPLVVQAAREGQGIGLGWSLLADDLLSRGELVRPVPDEIASPSGFYLVSRASSGAGADAFRQWVCEALAAPPAAVLPPS